MKRLLLLVTALLLAVPASAQVLRLKTGKLLIGEVETADENGLRFKRFDNGGVLDLGWGDLLGADAELLRRRYNLVADKETEDVELGVMRLRFSRAGVSREFLGELIRRDGDTFVLRRRGLIVKIPASDLTALPEKIRVPIHDVLTPDEIYNRKLAEVAPEEDPDKHVQVGVYLLQVHDYARAKQHLEAAQKFGGGAQPKKVTLYLARCATLIANKAEADLIGQINVLRNRKQFAKALDVVKEYDLRYAQGKLLSDFAKAKQLLERDRESEMVRVVTGIWYRVLRDEAAKIARNRALSWEEAQEAAEEKLGVAIRERIARAKKLTPEEIERFWKLRVERRVAKIQGSTYSTGTWVLGEQEIVKGTPYEKGKKAAQEGGQSTQQKRMNALRKRMEKFLKQARRAQKKGGDDPDEPDTEDQWWKAAATVTRQQWIMSYYAEHGSDMEVVNAFCRACITCGGRGYREVQGAVGKVQKVACGLCHKTKFIRSLRFR